MNNDDDLLFLDEDDDNTIPVNEKVLDSWNILIVDDDASIHDITELSLVNFIYDNKKLHFLHAFSMKEASQVLQEHDNIALVLLDVVMETNHAGLDLVHFIREKIDNHNIRIVLRTGQPGEAPERVIITQYDINDYVEKADLSAQKLFTVVVASLRSYKDIMTLNDSRTKLIESNQKLYDERRRIQVTLDSIGDAVLTTDALGRITHLNPVAENITGWKVEDARGLDLEKVFKIYNVHTKNKVMNPVQKVLDSGKIVELANHTMLIGKHGQEYHIADSAAPIRDQNGVIVGVILVCRDVTQSYQTEEALRRSQKMEAIGQLTGGIAHDFNNQLGIIIGYLDFLEEEYTEKDKQFKWIQTASKATMRCIDLTRQLLAFSRKQTTETKVLQLNVELEDMKNMIERSITPEVKVNYFLEENLWSVEANPGEFQDAILNLVINARDAMPEGGILNIETYNKTIDIQSTAQTNDYVQIVVSDTGMGMPKNIQERVLEPFFTTKPEGKGTGLGLSMVYGFLKRYQGFVKIYSEVDIGTTIRMYIPKSTLNQQILTNNEDNVLEKGNATILVVDDEEDLLALAQEYLNDLGYTTYTAHNGIEALEVLEKREGIDMIFSDVVMPGGISGYELAKQTKEKYPNVKILLTSGFTSKMIKQDNLTEFDKTLLNKPYRKVELSRSIYSALNEGVSNE